MAERVRGLPNDIHLVATAAGDVLVNSPPETLKYLLASGLPPPPYALLPPDAPPGSELGSRGFLRRGINYASVEFLIYANYFIQRRAMTLITVSAAQADRLRRVLEETVSGPAAADYGAAGWLRHECAAVGHYPPLGRAPGVADMVTVVSLEQGGGDLGAAQIDLVGDQFIFSEGGAVVAQVPTRIAQIARPLSIAPPQPLQRQELTLQFIGGSDGFDPAGITTCFLAYLGPTVQTQATLFDAAAYLRVRLGNLGLSASQIAEVVLSHLHEDHLAGLPELILMGGQRVRLVTAPLIYQSLLRVLGALLDLPPAEVATLFDYRPLEPGAPLELEGRRFEAIYAVHSIPTIAVRVGGVCYSGDMRYDEEWFAELQARAVMTAERHAELLRFAAGAAVLVQDVGGGAIHSTINRRLLQTLAAKNLRLVLAHTSRHLLPDDSGDLAAQVEFAGSGHVVGIGALVPDDDQVERLETVTACPLFARLPVAERAALAAASALAAHPDGALILREGERSDGSAYIVHSGLVEIQIGDQPVRLLGRGSSIGERGALIGEARTSSMIARGAVELLRLAPATFAAVADRLGLPAAFARAEWLWRLPLLRDLPWATLLDLALDFAPRQLAAGAPIFACGEPGLEGYLLVAGGVELADAQGLPLADVVGVGEFFGVRAALYGTPHAVAAAAAGPAEVWAIGVPALERLNMLYPNLLLHLRTGERGGRP